jgi:predicted phosphodiesterase
MSMACSNRRSTLGLLAGALSACVRFNAFEVEPSSEEQNLTAKSLTRLAAQDRDRPPASEQPLTLAVLSDTHDGYDAFKSIVDAINARPEIELVLHAGDITDFGTQQEYHWAYDCFSQLDTPFIAAPGNHDGLSEGKELYSLVFGPANFAFDYAGLHFVVFNTNTLEWDVEDPDFVFLERETLSRETPNLLLSHQPPYSEPHLTPAASARFVELLRRVSVYFYGHVHEGFAREQVGDTDFVKTASALDGSWILVTTDGTTLDAGACRYDTCDLEPWLDVAPGAKPRAEEGAP